MGQCQQNQIFELNKLYRLGTSLIRSTLLVVIKVIEMKNYKIKVNDEAESKEIISLFVQLGYFKQQPQNHKFNFYIYANNNGTLSFGDKLNTFKSNNSKELTLPQLRDLVAQSKSKVREYLDPNDNYKLCLINPSDSAHWMIEVPEGATLLTKDVGGYLTFWNGDLSMNVGESGWSSPEIDGGVLSFDEYKDYGYTTLWSREPAKEQGLISGADAKLAWAKGEDVQLECHDGTFHTITHNLSLSIFDDERVKFRLKPRTIKLELEIPAPFEPKHGEEAWCLDGATLNGYKKVIFDDFDLGMGFWRTEEEIKQVVAALRGIKG